MSYSFSRSLLTAVSVSALCFACGSDQKESNTPADVPAAEAPIDATLPTGEPVTQAPTGQPTSVPPPDSRGDTSSTNTVAMPQSPTEPVGAPRLTESQIAMVADLANTAEIEQGKLAQTRAKSASVKKFAAMMVKHHTESKNEHAKLFKQLSLTPAQSPRAMALKQDGDRMLGSLRGADGAAFDVTYIDSQVEAHQKVLDTLNTELLPAATDQELVKGLNKMKATVEEHLREAKTIQAELAKNR